ncbi:MULTISPECIES: M48 family metalloprotease [Flavobacterium]|uniref:M48 family metalloprotease n=1 Tax=Flavobacterium hankyongi TaxID=1176532 RepID=A0ABP8ZKJ2_9FLAO|nr:M48 family metalloprotease [Flavobacterium sp. N1846]
MKTIKIVGLAVVMFSGTLHAQINLGEKALGAVQKGVAGFTFNDEDAAALSKEAVVKMDAENKVAGPKDAYTLRLNKIFGKHSAENGLKLNYKVYLTKDVNAFATADGSVRVFSGLMDIMDDNELLAVIGHEIGHVANHDTRDAVKAAYKKEALVDAVASQSDKVAKLTDSQYAKIGSAMIDSRHSRQQESEADLFSYDFMKRHKYNVNAVESAFTILAKQSEGTESNFLTRMMSSHPEPKQRAEVAKQRAIADGLYKPYVKQAAVKKAVVKKKK